MGILGVGGFTPDKQSALNTHLSIVQNESIETQEYARAAFYLHLHYMEINDHEKALPWIGKALNGRYGKAELFVAKKYWLSSQERKQSLTYFRRAAKLGLSDGVVGLGLCNYYGIDEIA